MIVRDEEELLTNCLASLHLDGKPIWDELVVLDTGSVDKTVEIARAYGATVRHFEWVDDYAAARNMCETYATGDYIFWIDGDERLDEGHQLIRDIVEQGEDDLIRPVCYVKEDDTGRPSASHMRQELLRRRGSGKWCGTVHEYLDGGLGRPERRIVYRHCERTSEKRPKAYDDHVGALGDGVKALESRALFYYMLELYEQNKYVETIAIGELLLSRETEFPFERAQAALRIGDSYRFLGNLKQTYVNYMRCIQECDIWAEPFFSLGGLYFEMGYYDRARVWLQTAVAIEEPPDMGFFDSSIYRWRRYALLGECLNRLGRFTEATIWLQTACDAGANEATNALLAELKAKEEPEIYDDWPVGGPTWPHSTSRHPTPQPVRS
jgi:glycosyltransferase involved in cell wall biosynthesis